MALVPFLEGGDPAAVWQAARRIRQLLPGDRMSDPEAILWLLARDRYNMEQLDVVIGRHHMQALLDLIKRSPLWQEAESEGEAIGEARGKAEGEARGRLAAQREMCLRLVARHHPALLAEAAPRIAACDNCDLLQSWILAASEPDTETLARLLA
jgi:hypothetical protein